MERVEVTLGELPTDGILEILQAIRPAWNPDSVVIKDVMGGHVNRLYSAGLADYKDEDDVVLVRVYGPGADYITDKEKEVLAMMIAHHRGLAAPVYCRLQNGFACKYYRGCAMTKKNQTNVSVARGVAKALAGLHQLDYLEVLQKLGQADKGSKFNQRLHNTGLLPFPLSDLCTDKQCDTANLMSSSEVTSELRRLERSIRDLDLPLVLCHNDLNASNIVYDAMSDEVHFVDWDLADLNFAIYDIGVLFASQCYSSGPESAPDLLALYPDKEYQTKWIRWYLGYLHGLEGEPSTELGDEVPKVYLRGANLAAMYWTLGVSVWLIGQGILVTQEAVFNKIARHFQNIFKMIKEQIESGM